MQVCNELTREYRCSYHLLLGWPWSLMKKNKKESIQTKPNNNNLEENFLFNFIKLSANYIDKIYIYKVEGVYIGKTHNILGLLL